jgi:hypothetical protein
MSVDREGEGEYDPRERVHEASRTQYGKACESGCGLCEAKGPDRDLGPFQIEYAVGNQAGRV